MKDKQKVLFIGGGIAGPALALFLARAGIKAEIYEARCVEEDTGFFLYLAPNGMNVLKTLGLERQLERRGVPTTGITFFNRHDKVIGELDNRLDKERYGVRGQVLKRTYLHSVLREEVHRQGIRMEFGKKLEPLRDTGKSVVAQFEDGSTAEGDSLIGCDGIHSRTRQLILPASPAPAYTGLMDCGGFASLPALRYQSGPQHMTFGKEAFFAYVVHPSGEVYWFSNVPWPDEPSRETLGRHHERRLESAAARVARQRSPPHSRHHPRHTRRTYGQVAPARHAVPTHLASRPRLPVRRCSARDLTKFRSESLPSVGIGHRAR